MNKLIQKIRRLWCSHSFSTMDVLKGIDASLINCRKCGLSFRDAITPEKLAKIKLSIQHLSRFKPRVEEIKI